MNLCTLADLKRYLSIAYGGITSVPVTTPGSLYTVAPTVVMTDPAGTGFAAVAVLVGGAVTAIQVTNQGYGYTAGAVASLTGGDGSGAVAGTPVVQPNATGGDGLLSALITGASGLFYQATSRKVLLATDPANPITEIRDGVGQRSLPTLEFPIVSVASLTLGNLAQVPSPAYPDAGYLISGTRDAIGLRGQHFFGGFAGITLVYTAGYAADSQEAATIADAVVILAATKYKRISHLDQVSQSLSGQMVATFSTKDIPPEVQTVIGLFSRPPVFG